MIEIRATNHITARLAAMARNGGRTVHISAVYRREDEATARYVFRTSSVGGAA
jgi:hypothetical protein